MKVCNVPGCPTLTKHSRCLDHRREAEAARGSRQARGYDREHDALRRSLLTTVTQGLHVCWRCTEQIRAGEPWDLGHHDDGTHAGPEHRHCNRSAGGKAAHEG